MKEFAILVLGFIFVISIASFVQFVAADHLEPGIGIYKNQDDINIVSTVDSKYEMHLIVEIRNAQGQLISISESAYGWTIPHKITDYAFDEKLGKKEIITIDNTKYEKAQYAGPIDVKQIFDVGLAGPGTEAYVGLWKFDLCGEIDGHGYGCMPAFQTNTSVVPVTKEDVVTNHWTVLREMR